VAAATIAEQGLVRNLDNYRYQQYNQGRKTQACYQEKESATNQP
jgi:hypothetical protein